MKFKKILVMMFTTMVAIMSLTSIASAATTADIVTLLNKSAVLKVYVSQAESYLNSRTITSGQADAIISRINSVNTIVGDKKKLSDLTSPQKLAILNEFTAAGLVLDLAVTYNSGVILVKESGTSGRTVFTVAYPTANLIKQTGFDYSIALYGFAMILLAGVAGFATRKILLTSKQK